jgi:hypothetical protein
VFRYRLDLDISDNERGKQPAKAERFAEFRRNAGRIAIGALRDAKEKRG